MSFRSSISKFNPSILSIIIADLMGDLGDEKFEAEKFDSLDNLAPRTCDCPKYKALSQSLLVTLVGVA